MGQDSLTMSQKETLAQIYDIIHEISAFKQKMVDNSDDINRRLADFSLSSESYGSDVYGENPYVLDNNTEFSLPGESEYVSLRNLINDDIDDIEEMIRKHKILADLLKDVPLTPQLLADTSISLDDLDKLVQQRDARINFLSELDNTYNLAREQYSDRMKELENVRDNIMPTTNNTNQPENTNSGPGGSPGGSNGSGPGGSPGGNTGGNTGNNNNNNNSPTSSNDDSGDTPKVEGTIRPELTGFNTSVSFDSLSFNASGDDLTMDYLGSCATKLANHANNVSNILQFVSIDGKTPGADFYGVKIDPNAGDIKFNPGALQMALDAVDAHIKATEQYIALLQAKIAANAAKIEVLKAKARAAEAKHKDASGYYTEIASLENENVQLQASVQDYTGKLQEENEIYNELGRYWNSYNKVCGGLGSAFVAVDFMDKISNMNGDANLYGLELTETQRKSLFNNLGKTVSGLAGDLSSVFNKKNEYCGGLTADQIGFIVAGCNILGKSGTTFQENVNLFRDFNKAASEAGGFHNMDQSTIDKFTGGNNASAKQGDAIITDTETDVDTKKLDANRADKNEKIENDNKVENKDSSKKSSEIDPEKAVVDTLDGCKLALQYTAEHKAKSDVILDDLVADFMTQHAGKTVIVRPDIRRALDLQTYGYMCIPENYNTEDAFPFLLWLPGTEFSQFAQDGLANKFTGEPLLKHLLAGQYKNDKGIIFISTGWGSGETALSNVKYSVDPINHDLHQIMEHLNVDKDHIACAGTSIGAYAAGALVYKNPDTFSAVELTGGSFGVFNDYTFKDIYDKNPNTTFIWINGDNDHTTIRDYYDFRTNKTYKNYGVIDYSYLQFLALREEGANAYFYEINGGPGHAGAIERLPTIAVLNDLLSIGRGDEFEPLPNENEDQKVIVDLKDTIANKQVGNDMTPKWYKSLKV